MANMYHVLTLLRDKENNNCEVIMMLDNIIIYNNDEYPVLFFTGHRRYKKIKYADGK